MSDESRKAEFLRPKNTYADLMEEVREYIDMSPEERDRILQLVCRSVMHQLAEKPAEERRRILEWEDPLPEDFWIHWKRLMADYRRV